MEEDFFWHYQTVDLKSCDNFLIKLILRHVPKNFQAIPFQINAKNWIFEILDSQISMYQLKCPSLGSSKRALLSFQDERCPSYEHRKRTMLSHSQKLLPLISRDILNF
jgi:hypothetical protein